MRKIKYLGLLAVTFIVGYLVYDAVSLPGVGDLEGGFKEVAFYRNENNTGPVVRIYAVSVKTPEDGEMKTYGDLMPYNKYGTTTVYFFEEGGPLPGKLSREEPHFDSHLAKYCLASYKKDPMGQVTFSSKSDPSR
jgi:hypothetical protein